jgi:uncharacterized membrane protein YsdA (DUF1294 family)
MRYYLIFGLIAIGLGGFLYSVIYHNTDWNPYLVWLAALSGATFVIYGLDKLFSKIDWGRAPEKLLHLLALAGGFPGGWAGMFLFHHKTNFRKKPAIWFFLILATVGHAALGYYWFHLGN